MDRFQCLECGEYFYFDMELEGMTASPGERVGLPCPHCMYPWSVYRPDDLDAQLH